MAYPFWDMEADAYVANRFPILLRALSGIGVRIPAMQFKVPKASAGQSAPRGLCRHDGVDSSLPTQPSL